MLKIKERAALVALMAYAALPWHQALADDSAKADPSVTPPVGSASAATPPIPTTELTPVVVTGSVKRLNAARTSIQTQTGASVYRIDSAAIAAMPGGDNTQMNQVLLQAPDVAQDSFGQFHVRGEHAGLQYRLNGIILPEGIAVFGQTLDPRLVDSVDLITGALPAEFGLRTSGIIDIKTKSGALEPGGSVSIYAGSHGTLQPSLDYAGSSGDIQYFVSGDFLTSGLGIESPDGSSNPLHDQTHQHHGFGYIEKLIDANNRVGAGLGSSVGSFEIPNRGNQQTTYALTGTTPTPYPSDTLNENQREVTQFAFLSYQHSDGQLDWQTSLVSRYSSLTFNPDVTGDLLFDGIAQHAYKLNKALALQSDASYRVNDDHTLRAGVFIQHDRSISRTNSQVFVLDSPGGNQVVNPSTGDNQTESIVDNGNQAEWIESLYAQDEWAFAPTWTLNYGLRFDHYNAYSSGQQLSPRVNVVWKATPQTTVHAGYSRYFSPPPFELVGSASVAKYLSPPTSATPEVTQNDTPQAERANYLDLGVDQKLSSAWSVGVDSYFKRSHNLIDEGQFGAPIILTPFNYAKGTQYGAEFKINYAGPRLSAYGNLALQSAKGRNINSSQFNFGADDLAYIANHYIDLDHEQHLTASAGISYLWQGVRFNADALLGSGLRADRMLADGTTIPNGAHLPFYAQINVGVSRKIYTSDTQWYSLRLDVINLLDRKYEIRDGSGVGVGAPQYGPRRGVFIGVSKSL